MKTNMTKAVLIAALFGISLGAKAQSSKGPGADGIKLSIGAETGLSTGNFKDTHKANFGGSVQADIPVANQFYVNVNAGYVDYFGKNNLSGTGISAPDIHVLPVMAGLKYFPVGKLYVQADAGAAFALNKGSVGYAKSTAFLYVPQAGYEFQLGGKSFIDAGIRYEGTTSFNGNTAYGKINQVGLRVAYGLGL
ncbi:hypothetical protein [Mucilaginibacter rubeus]|uniref:Outer membrane protein beta-barrel domain-containing protein n=1 Tax=Mucilaginibacter rubeus TaxID=2027860 RepID=A0A5C1I158_9SPHI|nr:hypothetical protein [Mucilaginibacter rubeus]QEM11705.1 hypothetical protein DEO27_017280 [Mucilaginibacter rubeus]